MNNRYSAQSPLIGNNGQERLKKSRVLAIGCGGLAAVTLPYLVASGVGHITLFDGDKVEASNLNRQILFTEEDIGVNKATALMIKLKQQNPTVDICAYSSFFSLEDGQKLVPDYDLVLDLSDTYATKTLINYLCQQYQSPWIYASVLRWNGQVAAFSMQNEHSPCYKCLFPTTNKMVNCSDNGVIGAAVGVIASYQSILAIQTLLGETGHYNKLHVFDLWNLTKKEFNLFRDEKCKFHQDIHYIPTISYDDIYAKVNVRLIDVRSLLEWEQGSLPNAERILMADLMNNPMQLFSKNDTIVIYCHSQTLSDLAVGFLIENGLNAYSLHGGFSKATKR